MLFRGCRNEADVVVYTLESYGQRKTKYRWRGLFPSPPDLLIGNDQHKISSCQQTTTYRLTSHSWRSTRKLRQSKKILQSTPPSSATLGRRFWDTRRRRRWPRPSYLHTSRKSPWKPSVHTCERCFQQQTRFSFSIIKHMAYKASVREYRGDASCNKWHVTWQVSSETAIAWCEN